MRSRTRYGMRLVVLLFGLVCARQTPAAPILYIDDAFNQLGTVDIGTGAVTVIGDMGADLMTDIAFAPNGTLYGVSFTNLYTINTTTGAATLVGSTGRNDLNALVFASDGTLYSVGGAANLYTLNPTNGAATTLGSVGFASAGDLAFNGGNLYMSASTGNQLILIDLDPVSGSAVGPIGFTSVLGLATAADGVLYGVSGFNVISVNTSTGAGTLIRNYAGGNLGNALGSSFVGEAVPEPSTLALLAFGLVLCTGSRFRRHNRG